jgi:hypothetical protein
LAVADWLVLPAVADWLVLGRRWLAGFYLNVNYMPPNNQPRLQHTMEKTADLVDNLVASRNPPPNNQPRLQHTMNKTSDLVDNLVASRNQSRTLSRKPLPPPTISPRRPSKTFKPPLVRPAPRTKKVRKKYISMVYRKNNRYNVYYG